MKIERTKNATRNIVFGVILKVYQIVIPFLMRTAMIYFMGVQYLGLSSLFISILQVLNLAELGVGSAMVFSMYKPIANDDRVEICALMNLYKIYYRVIGFVIGVIGCVLLPFIPRLIKGEIPSDINIYVLYLLNLSATVCSYWLFAYKNSILLAHQRTDVSSKVTLCTNTVQFVLQFVVLWLMKNYYVYIMVALLGQILTNIVTAIVADRLYPEFKPEGKLPKNEVKQINQRIKDLFTAKLGSVIIGSVDTIVISSFLGLTTLAIYQNYYYIMNAVCGFIGVIFTSIIAGVGNSLMTESDEKNYNDFKKFTFLICFVLCICCCCFVGLYQPFMKLWVGENLMLDDSYVVLFCVLFYCLELAMVWATIKDAGGIWHADRFRPLIGALANLIMNLIMVNIIGLYGIMLSTVFSYVFISMPWLIHNLFKLVYKCSLFSYLKDVFIYIIVTVVAAIITMTFCSIIDFDGLLGLLIKAVVCFVTPFIVECIVYCRKKEFKESFCLVKKMLKRG